MKRIMSPNPMMTTPQVTPRMMVKRFRLRSATPEELNPELIPPPNMSDKPPPRPLCRRISSVSRRLVIASRICKMT